MSNLEHHGVKGMRWGVRKSSVTKSHKKKEKKPSYLKRNIDSVKREIETSRSINDLSNMSESELRSKTTRIRYENDLKRLSSSARGKGAGAKKDLYLDRAKLSDAEIKIKVDRLQLEDNLQRNILTANKQNMEKANQLINAASGLALSYYTSSDGGFSATGSDLADNYLKEGMKYAKTNKIVK